MWLSEFIIFFTINNNNNNSLIVFKNDFKSDWKPELVLLVDWLLLIWILIVFLLMTYEHCFSSAFFAILKKHVHSILFWLYIAIIANWNLNQKTLFFYIFLLQVDITADSQFECIQLIWIFWLINLFVSTRN